MARASVQKRQRERKRDEKAARKREDRVQRPPQEDAGGPRVATSDDLAGYGLDASAPSRDEDVEDGR